MIAYLSGSMENANNEGSEWRKEITVWLKENLDHSVIDPVAQTAKLAADSKSQNYRDWKKTDPEKFIGFVRKAIANDLDAVINKADYIICLWNDDVLRGGGTHGEVTIAYYFNKPIYLINQLKRYDLSGWIMSCATETFTDFETIKNKLIEVYK